MNTENIKIVIPRNSSKSQTDILNICLNFWMKDKDVLKNIVLTQDIAEKSLDS